MNPPEPPTRVLGYRRVSTIEQTDSGAGLEAQASALKAAAASRGWAIELVTEEAASGKSMDRRPVLAEALARLKAGDVDVLAVSKLDRLTRSLLDFARLLERSDREKWSLVVIDLGVDTSSPSGRLAANVVASAAEFERAMISLRTREALAQKKRQGIRLGRKHATEPAVLARVVAERDAGSTWQAIADRLNADNIPTVRGAAGWRTSAVQSAYKTARLD
ncbi:MAG: recombinase family protein, partial [Mycobacteriales bacterium]